MGDKKTTSETSRNHTATNTLFNITEHKTEIKTPEGETFSGKGFSSEEADANASDNYDNDNADSGSCYLTTACVGAMGLTDDCLELTTLRWFRDSFLRKQRDGEALIEEYYQTAPDVIKRIHTLPDSKARFVRIYRELIAPCVGLVLQGKLDEAKTAYVNYTRRLGVETNLF